MAPPKSSSVPQVRQPSGVNTIVTSSWARIARRRPGAQPRGGEVLVPDALVVCERFSAADTRTRPVEAAPRRRTVPACRSGGWRAGARRAFLPSACGRPWRQGCRLRPAGTRRSTGMPSRPVPWLRAWRSGVRRAARPAGRPSRRSLHGAAAGARHANAAATVPGSVTGQSQCLAPDRVLASGPAPSRPLRDPRPRRRRRRGGARPQGRLDPGKADDRSSVRPSGAARLGSVDGEVERLLCLRRHRDATPARRRRLRRLNLAADVVVADAERLERRGRAAALGLDRPSSRCSVPM